MIRASVVLSAVIFAAINASAQFKDISESQIQTSVDWRHQIVNSSESPIVAFHSSFHCAAGGSQPKGTADFMFDSLVNYSRDKPIAPSDAFSYPMQKWTVGCPGGVDAILFADGRSEGAPDKIAYIHDSEKGVLEGLAFVLPLLESVTTAGKDPQAIATELEARSQDLLKDNSRAAAECLGEIYALGVVAHVLKSQNDLFVPSDLTTNHQPHIATLAESKGINMRQAHAQVIALKLQEWMAALKQNLQQKGSQ